MEKEKEFIETFGFDINEATPETYKGFFQKMLTSKNNTTRESLLNAEKKVYEIFDLIPSKHRVNVLFGLISTDNIEINQYKRMIETCFLKLDIKSLFSMYSPSEKYLQLKYGWDINHIIIKTLKTNWKETPEFYDSVPWEIFDCIFKNYEYGLRENLDNDVEWTIGYVSYMLKTKIMPFSNQYLIHLADELENPKCFLSNNSKAKLKEMFGEYRASVPEVDLNKYSEYMQTLEQSTDYDHNEFLDFLHDVLLYREKNGILPEEICDLFIKLKINQRGYLLKAKSEDRSEIEEIQIFETDIYRGILEDKAKYIVQKRDLEKIPVRIESNARFGGYNGSKHAISISTELLEEMVQTGSMRIFLTLFHEIKHYERKNRVYSIRKCRNFFDYYMIKEVMVCDLFNEFYNEKYKNLGFEIEGLIAGTQDTVDYIQNDLQLPVDFALLGNDVEEKLKRDREHIKGIFARDTMNLFSKLVAIRPEILKSYPVFRLEYNEDGTSKTREEFLKEWEECQKMPKSAKKLFHLSVIRFALARLENKPKVEHD